MRGVTVIANACAGQGCTDDWSLTVRQTFQKFGLNADVRLVQSGQDIVQAAEDAVARGVLIVVAAGGDGTVSAIASKVAGTHCVMGVVPMGTLNHFARDLGIPLELDAAIEAMARGREMQVDIGDVNGRTFINNASLGLYPDIVRDREGQRSRLGRGKWTALLFASLSAARRYPVLHLRIDVDGKPITRRSAFVFIGNNKYTMEGFEIGERARLDEGVLSLYVTQRMGRFGLLGLAIRALVHRLRQARDFDMVTATTLAVDAPGHHMRVATDGEVTLMQTPLQFRIRPGALRVIVPATETATVNGSPADLDIAPLQGQQQ